MRKMKRFIYQQILMMNLYIEILAFLLLTSALSEIKPIEISQYMFQPRVYRQQVPGKNFKKLIHENFVQSVNEVNFELASYLYVHDGALWGDDAYNISNYGGFSSECRIYKTDLKMRQYSEVAYTAPPDATLVIQYNQTKKKGEFASIYVAHENNKITITDVLLGGEMGGLSMDKVQMKTNNYRIQQGSENILVSTTKDDKLNLINILGTPYIIISNKMLRYERASNSQTQVKGFQNPGEKLILRAQTIKNLNTENNVRFYTMTSNEIRIFQVVDNLTVSLVKSISDIKDANLLTIAEDNGYFYATALNRLFIIDMSDPNADYKVYSAAVNGSCSYIQKFQTTLHLGCFYDKLFYIVELFTIGNQVAINRFYANQDIEGRAMVRRIGMGKMAILTDNDLRITNYGINRNTLIETDQLQPEFLFSLRYGLDLMTIDVASSEFVMTMVLFCNDKLAVLKLLQQPPEIYCEYPTDSVGAQYQILMQFNTSRCSYVEYQEDLLYGNIESVCEISVPILVETRQVQLQVKHTNFIQFILAVILIVLLLVILACFIKYNRGLQSTYHNLVAALQKAKSGYKDKKAPI